MIVTERCSLGWPAGAVALLGRLRGSEHPLAQLVRFAIVGGLSNVLYLALFVLIGDYNAQLANLVATVASTMLVNELHRQITFHATDRVDCLAAQRKGGALMVAGLAISSTAIAITQSAFPGIGSPALAAVTIAVGAAVGGLRFLALRRWVF